MSRNVAIILICVTVTCLLFSATCYAEVEIGVKEGDWVEYDVDVTGDVSPEHSVTWAKMEYIKVQGKTAELNIISRYTNGTEGSEVTHLDLETGKTGDSFLIPANLKKGDVYTEQYHGNITILDVTQRTYAGATRNTAHGEALKTVFYWDVETGVMLEARSTYDNFTINTVAQKTNIWEPETGGLDTIIIIVAMVAVIAVVAIVAIRRRVKK